jgi:hypothetical protein
LAFDIVFLYAVLKNRQDLLNLHWAILLVIIVATLEALAWFLAFDVMNSSGVPYCCPFPPVVIFAMVRAHHLNIVLSMLSSSSLSLSPPLDVFPTTLSDATV